MPSSGSRITRHNEVPPPRKSRAPEDLADRRGRLSAALAAAGDAHASRKLAVCMSAGVEAVGALGAGKQLVTFWGLASGRWVRRSRNRKVKKASEAA